MILDTGNLIGKDESLIKKAELFSEHEFIKNSDLIARQSDSPDTLIFLCYSLQHNKATHPKAFAEEKLISIAKEFDLSLTLTDTNFIHLTHAHTHEGAPAQEEKPKKKKINSSGL